jgi:cytochrome oxidase assembly protein ShyY1
MRRLIGDPRWWGLVALALLIAVSAVFLGRWQFGRWEQRIERNDRLAAALAEPTAPAEQLFSPAAQPTQEWRPATVTGEYLPGSTVLVRNRPQEGRNGYRVLAGLQTDAGPVLVVDRGWIPAGTTAAAPDEIPELPDGAVTVTGRVRVDEAGTPADDLPAGQTTVISSAAVSAEPRYRGHLELGTEVPAPAVAPIPAPLPPTGSGPHLIYALQWWFFAGLSIVGLVILSRRQVRDAVEEAG